VFTLGVTDDARWPLEGPRQRKNRHPGPGLHIKRVVMYIISIDRAEENAFTTPKSCPSS
jgi:hypothetical protein